MKHAMLVTLAITALLCAAAPEMPHQSGDFPRTGLQPKRETGVDRFLAAHPDYDGRGVVVAIFDTGVDPGAPGLQVTSDGKPKIVDMVDASGSGDVETTVIRKATDGEFEGMTGRTIPIPAAWNNPTGEFHVGIKRAFELYPGGLVRRLKAKRREKWDEQQRAAVTEVKRALADWDAGHKKPTTDELKTREDLETRLAQLEALQKDYDDPGPIFDCVVFHDGDVWRAAIDTDEDGDLADEKLLTNYKLERQFATFGDEDLLNFAVNIYEDGNLLSIVTDAGAHGTHVAGIVAANIPDHSELNGMAPGAQLVSVKIGDTRVGSSSMGTGEVRGAIAVLQNKCDLINMSYGGPTPAPDVGRIIDIYSEIVNKHGVIWVCSAGNEGPALTTVGSPGGTTSALLGVGAVISPEMMSVQYSLRDTVNETQYTWSSRGPTTDGDLGVVFSAPGGAISPVPNWTLQPNMQMNGTSMASPNACGGIALLLSGMKSEGKPYSPQIVRTALENTARQIRNLDVFSQGRGMIQIDDAWEYLQRFDPYSKSEVRFEARIPGRDNARGIYLREPPETLRPFVENVSVNPVFHDDAENREKVHFELRVTLEATERWIEVADHLLLMHGGRSFEVRVDPTRLEPGVHYAEIRGFDASRPERGPIFRIPITVVRPLRPDPAEPVAWNETIRFEPGQVERRFIAVPPGATWADLRIRTVAADARRRLLVHAVQLLPGRASEDGEYKQYITMSPGGEEVRSFPVMGDRTLELALAQYWSSLGESEFEFELTFHGVVPDDRHVVVDGNELQTRLDLSADLGRIELRPSATLDTWRQALRPTDSQLHPLDGVRDRLPEERQIYELILTYEVKQPEDGKIHPRPVLTIDGESWDSWESMIWMLFDEHKRRVAVGEIASDPISLDNGDYTLRFHVRSTELDHLQKLEDMVMQIDRPLDKSLSPRILDDPRGAIAGGHNFGTRTLEAGQRTHLFFASLDADALPKHAAGGDLLLGNYSLAAADGSLLGAGKRPGGYPLTYVVPPKPADKPEPKASDAEQKDERTDLEKLAEDVRDLRVKRLAALGDDEQAAFDEIAAAVLADWPDHLPVFAARLHRIDRDNRDEHLPEIVAAADEIIQRIDTTALAEHYGIKLDEDDPAAKKTRKDMDERKDALLDALYRKGRAMSYMLTDLREAAEAKQAGDANQSATAADVSKATGQSAANGNAAKSAAASASSGEVSSAGEDASAAADRPAIPWDEPTLRQMFEDNFQALARWVDTTQKDYVLLHIARERLHGRQGEALQLLNKRIADGPEKRLYEKRIGLLKDLGWRHWADYEQRWQLLRYPEAFPRF